MTSRSSSAASAVKPAIEIGQRGRRLHPHAPMIGSAEEHVVVAAGGAPRGPLVPEQRDQPSVARALARQSLHLAPLEVVEPVVVLAERGEVEATVVARPGPVAAGRALPFGHAGVAVGLAPEDPCARTARAARLADPDRVRGRRDRSVRRAHLEAVDAGRFETQVGRRSASAADDDAPAAGIEADLLAREQHAIRRAWSRWRDSSSGPRCARSARSVRRATPPTARSRSRPPPCRPRSPPRGQRGVRKSPLPSKSK